MAEIVGLGAMSHGPQLMITPDRWDVLVKKDKKRYENSLPVKPELKDETLEVKWAKWNRCMEAIACLRKKLQEWSPEALLIVADDQHENLLDNNMPPFMIYIGEEAEASVSLRYFNEPKSENRTKYRVHRPLAEQIVEELMDAGFDPAYSRVLNYEGGLGHAFARPLKFLMQEFSCPIVPVMVNTYHPPAPSATRCVQFGVALAEIIRRAKSLDRVAILGSGGLSHTVIDENLDRDVIRALEENDIKSLGALPSSVLVGGTSEIRNWVVTAAAANRSAKLVDYVPCYRTPTGTGCAMGFAYWEQ